jgi:hypothetical protein
MKAVTVLSLAALVMAACSTQGGGHDLVKSPSGQTCKLDVAAICSAARNAPVVDAATGITMDTQMRQNNSAATTYETMPFQIPNGSLVEIRCGIRASDSSVVYASLERGPQFTDHDVDFMKQSGYCSEQ